jgi:hypothetical protein
MTGTESANTKQVAAAADADTRNARRFGLFDPSLLIAALQKKLSIPQEVDHSFG